MVQSGEFLGRLLGPLIKFGLPIMKNVLKSSYKSVFIAVSSISTRHRNSWTSFWFGMSLWLSYTNLSMLASYPLDLAQQTTILIISNKWQKI